MIITVWPIEEPFFDHPKLLSDEYDDNIDFTYSQNTAIDGQSCAADDQSCVAGQSCAASFNGEMFVIGGARHKTQVHIRGFDVLVDS